MRADLAIRAQPPLRALSWRRRLLETARKAVRSGAILGYIFGIVVVSSAVSYTRIYRTRAEREHLAAAFGANRASAALFGPAPRLETVAGFTVFKSIMTLMVLGAVWGMLISTRLLRGEEEAGRWDLLLTGRTTPKRATVQAMGGLAVGVAMLWAADGRVSVLAVSIRRSASVPAAMLYFSVAQVATAVMFLPVGALTSQLAATRRRAATYSAWFWGQLRGADGR